MINLGERPKAHAIAKRIFHVALSPRAVLDLRPFVEESLSRRMTIWSEKAESGNVIVRHVQNFLLLTQSLKTLGKWNT